MASYHQQVGNLVTEHPYQSLGFGLLFAAIIIIIWNAVVRPAVSFLFGSEYFGTLVTNPSGSLDRSWGSCVDTPGQEHCGGAERFAARSTGAIFKGHKRSGFLNNRGAGPEVWGSQIAADYWNNELKGANPDSNVADPGSDAVTASMAAAQAAQQAVTAVAAGALPAAAAGAAASHFAAANLKMSQHSVEDSLGAKAYGYN